MFEDYEDIYFIISTGRTGTKSLANYLGGFHENFPISTRRIFFQKLLNETNWNNVCKTLSKRNGLIMHRKESGDKFIEANPFLSIFFNELRELYPTSKFITIVRDPRDVVRSGVSRPDHEWDRWDDAIRLHATADPSRLKWDNIGLLGQHLLRWKIINGLLIEDTRGQDDVLEVKFEDIFYGENRGFEEILDFTGVEQSKYTVNYGKKHNNTFNYKIPHYSDWDDDMITLTDNIVGTQMDEFDYTWNDEE